MKIQNSIKTPIYTINANPFKIIFGLVLLIALQIGCYSYVAISDYITIPFIFMVLFGTLQFCIMLFLIYVLVKYGIPKIIFTPKTCYIQAYTHQIEIPYQSILSLKLDKVKQTYRWFMYSYDYQLTLYLRNKNPEYNILKRKVTETNQVFIASKWIYRNQQTLKTAIIFTALCRMSQQEREETIIKLQQDSECFDQLIAPHEFKKFKNNQYISKSFKSGQ